MTLHFGFDFHITGDEEEREEIERLNRLIEDEGIRCQELAADIDLSHFNDLMKALGDIRRIVIRARASRKEG